MTADQKLKVAVAPKVVELARKTTQGAWVHFRIADDQTPVALRIDAEEIDSRRAAMSSGVPGSDVVFVAWGQSIEDAIAKGGENK